MSIGLYVRQLYSCRILTRLEFFRQIFENYSNFKLRENLFGGSRVVICGRTDATKPIVAFRNLANAPGKKYVNIAA
jgi:hypothetical protein